MEPNYRFYSCYHTSNNELHCVKIETSDYINLSHIHQGENTKLMFIPKYIPKIFDTFLLKINAMPSSVHIEED